MNPKRILFSNEEKIVIDDNRVHVQSSPDGDWNLHIEHVRYNDSGEYTCQINTSPVKIKRVFLYVQGNKYHACGLHLHSFHKAQLLRIAIYIYIYLLNDCLSLYICMYIVT